VVAVAFRRSRKRRTGGDCFNDQLAAAYSHEREHQQWDGDDGDDDDRPHPATLVRRS
jgi:hypothetical protein